METGRPTRALVRAFTLIELVLVLAMIAIVLGAVAPSMRGFAASRSAADTASQLLSLTKYARSQAIAAGRPCRVNVDSTAGEFWLSAAENGTFVEAQSDPGARIATSDGVTIRFRGSGAARPDGASYVEFQPSGRSAVETIEVLGRGGELYLVTCDSPTEGFYVVTPAEGAQ